VSENTVSFLDETGEIFKDLESGDSTEYPILTGLADASPLREKQISMAVGLLKALKREEGSISFDKVAEINIKANGLISLYLTDLKAEIRCIGSDFAGKIPELKRILGHLKDTGRAAQVAAIDLNYEDGVVVSFKKG
jgi:cell division septal protein FtsQ